MPSPSASPEIQEYFQDIEQKVSRCYEIAGQLRQKGLDPEDKVDIPLAKNMAERVINLVSAAAVSFQDKKINQKITQRIQDLEQEYSLLDWRVALKIAEEIAKEKFCKFDSRHQALEVGIRVGFAYLTLGIVSAPLEGFIGLKLKKRKDGREYFALQYAGPVRGAGGTAAASSLLIGDYLRKRFGYSPYDPNDDEISRWSTEVHDYHDRVTNLQYYPSDEEINFLARHLPVEIDGDPTEKFEVSNYKDLPRIETNRLRGGFCLVLAEGLAQKAPKLWKRLSRWGKDFDLEWNFLEEFLTLQKKIKAQETRKQKTSSTALEEKIKPNYTYIADLVAGRPVLSYPLTVGGFRLRYGRTRTSGFSTAALNPATLYLLNKYLAIGTQLKVERPGKAASVSVCDVLEGPLVRLKDQTVLSVNTLARAKEVLDQTEEILFLGDILFNYGDFSENGHLLVPPGYTPEFWIQELEKSVVDTFGNLDLEKLSNFIEINLARLKEIFQNPLTVFPTPSEALRLSREMNIPLHPSYTYHWRLITQSDLLLLKEWLLQGSFKKDLHQFLKIILPLNEQTRKAKKVLEAIGLPHLVINNENVVLESKESTILSSCLNFENQEDLKKFNPSLLPETDTLAILNQVSKLRLRDKSGTFIGARMGRPEKAKQRKMTGSPQVMFPVGQEGDRLRSFQAALQAGKIRADFPLYYCPSCQKETIYRLCENCRRKTLQRYFCRFCGSLNQERCKHGPAQKYKTQDLDINYYFQNALQKLQMKTFPDLIKGVRGTSNKDHLPEPLVKGILRAKHDLYVNKDGTTRFDCTEQPCTHFRPKEIRTPLEKLRQLGYQRDIHGKDLADENQLLELFPQDIILPGYDSLEGSAPQVLFQVANFIDELLAKFYDSPPFYNFKSKEDLVGHLIIGLAPHTSAGLVGRIIGFSQLQSFLAHPMFHAGMRRDCFTYETRLPLYDGTSWKNLPLGELVEKLNPQKTVDDFGTKAKKVRNFKTLGFNPQKKIMEIVPIREFTQHTPTEIIEIRTKQGRKLKVTTNHKFLINENLKLKRASQLKINDRLPLPYNYHILEKDINKYISFFSQEKKRKLNSAVRKIKPYGMRINKDNLFVYDPIISIERLPKEITYCLNVKHHHVIANGIITKQCDGDESSMMLLMDALLNFSRQYLPESRGGKHMDAPLVLTAVLNPSEVDDQVHGLDVVWRYPLEFYQAAPKYKNPWDVKIEQLKDRLTTPQQYQNFGFTHPVENFNQGVLCSAYKTLPTMEEKLQGQMDLAQKIRAVDKEDVAKLVIEKHFLKDIRGNLRKFSSQQFRCTKCNEKYRRPPLTNKCLKCGHNLLFTISEGSITKYLEPSLALTKNYDFSPYLKQSLEIVQENIYLIFGKEKDKQVGLAGFMN